MRNDRAANAVQKYGHLCVENQRPVGEMTYVVKTPPWPAPSKFTPSNQHNGARLQVEANVDQGRD